MKESELWEKYLSKIDLKPLLSRVFEQDNFGFVKLIFEDNMWSKDDVQRNTDNAVYYSEKLRSKLQRFDEDPDLKFRNECKYCHYISSTVATAAMTKYECQICGEEYLWSCGYTPKLCSECAKEHNLCRMCGGDLQMRTRRKKFNWIKKEKQNE